MAAGEKNLDVSNASDVCGHFGPLQNSLNASPWSYVCSRRYHCDRLVNSGLAVKKFVLAILTSFLKGCAPCARLPPPVASVEKGVWGATLLKCIRSFSTRGKTSMTGQGDHFQISKMPVQPKLLVETTPKHIFCIVFSCPMAAIYLVWGHCCYLPLVGKFVWKPQKDR